MFPATGNPGFFASLWFDKWALIVILNADIGKAFTVFVF
jgi:hypothetical protein